MAASLVIVNARIWTNDARRPWADALSVDGDRISAVGSSAEIMKRATSARVIDAKGAMVIPGHEDPRAAIRQAGSAEDVLASRGVLRTGAPAHLMALDRDITRLAMDAIDELRVLWVVVDGAVRPER